MQRLDEALGRSLVDFALMARSISGPLHGSQ
jgi:hypothetical protein